VGWVHEIKHDGHRVIAYLDRGNVRLVSRPGNDATRRFAPVAATLARLKVKQAIIDGEVSVPDERGVTHIDYFNQALKRDPARLAFYAFDLMFLDGLDVRRRDLPERKRALAEILARHPGRVLVSEHLACDGRALFKKVGELGCEGIVSKRIDAAYTSGPSKTWLKCKHSEVGAYRVIGYVPDGSRIESLLVAESTNRGLRPVGLVEFRRTGVLDGQAHKALTYLRRSKPCIALHPARRNICWTEPKLVATVKHFGWAGNALRAAVLQGLTVD
jgi:bifunctional non-homologous end joining protein LigD